MTPGAHARLLVEHGLGGQNSTRSFQRERSFGRAVEDPEGMDVVKNDPHVALVLVVLLLVSQNVSGVVLVVWWFVVVRGGGVCR